MPAYLIYSHEHGAWWRPRRLGYTGAIAEAGHYSAEEAEQICADAAYGWRGGLPPEVMIAATPDVAVAAQRVGDATQSALKTKAERGERHFSPGYGGEKPDHHGPAATCAMPACVKSRARHEAVADLQDLTYELFADPDTKQDPADD